jgi:polyisoprenoid-binding protein YceI
MKKNSLILLATILLLTTTHRALAQATWQVDNAHSSITFSVTHLLISEVEGRFTSFGGSIKSSQPDFTDASIDFKVDVASINTDNDMRDNHLKSNDFFNVQTYPQMTFKSQSLVLKKDGTYTATGHLTIRDVTKQVSFDVTLGGVKKDPYGNTKAGFKAHTTINRQDFNLKWSGKTEAGEMVVSDKVDIKLLLEFTKQQ